MHISIMYILSIAKEYGIVQSSFLLDNSFRSCYYLFVNIYCEYS